MVWAVLLCLMDVAMAALDPATTLRKSLNPYVLYNFMDADTNGNSVTMAQDIANHSTVRFGNLQLGSRASWLVGRPGVQLARETTTTATSAMASTNKYDLAWTSNHFNSTFAFEIWYQFTTADGIGSLWSISREQTRAAQGFYSCNATEPMIELVRESSALSLKSSIVTSPTTCDYTLPLLMAQAGNVLITVGLIGRYTPNQNTLAWHKYEGATASVVNRVDLLAALSWKDTNANLRFSTSNNYGTMNVNILSFAIYPDLTQPEIDSLFAKGLPNAKPVAPSFGRAVPETVGGLIQLCPNVIGNSRSSDCPDYTNNATASGQTHTLTSRANLAVWIESLPARGVLSHLGTPITSVPFKLTNNNSVYFTPIADTTSWHATFTTQDNYTFYKNDYASFTYRVVDPDGASSKNATVNLEVYPTYTRTVAEDIPTADSSVYAGRLVTESSGLANAIFLVPTNREFIPPSQNHPACNASLVGTYTMCSLYRGAPNEKDTIVTIKSVPAIGQLKYRNIAQQLVNVNVGTQISVDTSRRCLGTATPPNCSPSWIVYYEVPLNLFDSTDEILDSVSFTYTATTTFDLTPFLGTTKYFVDSANAIQAVPWNATSESSTATANVNIRNGFFASPGYTNVKQQNLSIVAPQMITLDAQDLTLPSPFLEYYINSLPAKGGLFDLVNGQFTLITSVPHRLSNFTVGYQPSLITENYGFESGTNYASFVFYAMSDGKKSNNATHTINVIDTNDAVEIKWYATNPIPANGIIPFASDGLPQSWSDLADNQLWINFTDPDTVAPSEPLYKIDLKTSLSDFSIFLDDAVWADLQVNSESGLEGLQLGGPAAGAGSAQWIFIVNRSLAFKALNPIRLRPNKATTSSVLTVTITDCQRVPGRTSPIYQGADWSPKTTTALIFLSGSVEGKSNEFEGVANPVIQGVIYGVIGFVGLVFLICGYFGVRSCLRRRGGGGGGGSGKKSSSGGSKSSGGSTSTKKGGGKPKKAKSAYLHQVEVEL